MQALISRRETHNCQHNPRIMTFMHLALALVDDLGLARTPRSAHGHIIPIMDCVSALHSRIADRGSMTSTGTRAVLGCYYIMAMLSSCFKTVDPMPFTEHLQQCCDRLLADAEYSSDTMAVGLVQLQRITERYVGFSHKKSSLSMRSFVKCFEDDFALFRRSLSEKDTPKGVCMQSMSKYPSIVCAGMLNEKQHSSVSKP